VTAGPFIVYDQAALGVARKLFNLSTDNFNMVLVTNAYVPGGADQQYLNVSPFEAANSGGYTTGGMSMTGVSANLVTGLIPFTSDPVVWIFFSQIFRYAVVIQRASITLSPNDLLLCYCDCTGGGSVTGGGGPLTIAPNASGIFVITP
jgi:hypothetical protein